MAEERLQKVIAAAGVASRRHAEELIAAGRVTVNGEVVTALGTKVDIERDRVEVDGRPLSPEAKVYIVLHKPVGVVTTAEDTHDRPTVIDLVPADLGRLYPVGRLDMESSGLILLTNDGDLAYKLTHPSFEHEKEYRARVAGQPGERLLDNLRRGIELEDGPTLPAEIIVQERDRSSTLLRVILREGRKRQLRRMFEAIEHPVRELQRVRLGPLQIGDLRSGEWRRLSVRELQAIRRLAAGFPVQPVTPPQRVGGKREEREARGRPARRPAAPSAPSGPRPAKPGGTPTPPRKRAGRPDQPAARPSERGGRDEEPRRPTRRPAGAAPASARPGSRRSGGSGRPAAPPRSGGRRGASGAGSGDRSAPRAGPKSPPARSTGGRSSGPTTSRPTRPGAGSTGRRPPAGGRARPPRRGR